MLQASGVTWRLQIWQFQPSRLARRIWLMVSPLALRERRRCLPSFRRWCLAQASQQYLGGSVAPIALK